MQFQWISSLLWAQNQGWLIVRFFCTYLLLNHLAINLYLGCVEFSQYHPSTDWNFWEKHLTACAFWTHFLRNWGILSCLPSAIILMYMWTCGPCVLTECSKDVLSFNLCLNWCSKNRRKDSNTVGKRALSLRNEVTTLSESHHLAFNVNLSPSFCLDRAPLVAWEPCCSSSRRFPSSWTPLYVYKWCSSPLQRQPLPKLNSQIYTKLQFLNSKQVSMRSTSRV